MAYQRQQMEQFNVQVTAYDPDMISTITKVIKNSNKIF
jgi:hypothetical protein